MLWAVSQAAPLRRLVVANSLKLYEYRGGGAAGYASGGFLADSVVKGTVASGAQQQWLTRNSDVGKWAEGVWNSACNLFRAGFEHKRWLVVDL